MDIYDSDQITGCASTLLRVWAVPAVHSGHVRAEGGCSAHATMSKVQIQATCTNTIRSPEFSRSSWVYESDIWGVWGSSSSIRIPRTAQQSYCNPGRKFRQLFYLFKYSVGILCIASLRSHFLPRNLGDLQNQKKGAYLTGLTRALPPPPPPTLAPNAPPAVQHGSSGAGDKDEEQAASTAVVGRLPEVRRG